MVKVNLVRKEIVCKIVYYGPGLSGKTTNLEQVHKTAPEDRKGNLTSIQTEGDRTLFFDFMPLEIGKIKGIATKLQLYTVPGQVYYNSTRKLVLQGVDGIVFVADSSAGMLDENIDSYRNLADNLAEYGKKLSDVPHVIQFNKRDLKNALAVQDLDRVLNKYGMPTFEAIATTGNGVFPTVQCVTNMVLSSVSSPTKARSRMQSSVAKKGDDKSRKAKKKATKK